MDRFLQIEADLARTELDTAPSSDTADVDALRRSHARLVARMEGLLSQLPDEVLAPVYDISQQVAMEDGARWPLSVA
ncbi:hypothetical protein ACFTXJ_14720 [Streptomyces zhihengii]|uniref:hypothetical protein n=1 Tax=Streptomyces zhihengii TaxID=1818004 RepID=UPI00362FB141